MEQIKEGQKAPDFEFINQNGEEIKLSDFKGKKVILYFYPKDNTPGCTAEACNLRDNYEQLIKEGFEILGVSPDSESSHNNFRTKFSLPFTLIPDTENKIAELYGVWGEKSMYGKKYMGILRTTFLISENGIIEKVISKVKTSEHSQQIFDEYKK